MGGACAWIVLGGAGLLLATLELGLRVYVVPIVDASPHRVHLVYTSDKRDVVLGDSHFYRGSVTVDEFENLAQGGSSPGALQVVAHEYFRHRKPGRVVVEASPQLFSAARQREGTQQHDAYFTRNNGWTFPLYVFEPVLEAC